MPLLEIRRVSRESSVERVCLVALARDKPCSISLRGTGVTELTREIDHLESTVARLKPKKFDGDS